MKPGLGEYDCDGPDNLTTRSTRIRFLVLAAQFEPGLLRELHDRSYNLFWEFILSRRRKRLRIDFESWHSLICEDEATTLSSELQRWSAHWNLDANWCRDFAVQALWSWYRQSRQNRGNFWQHSTEFDWSLLDAPENDQTIRELSVRLSAQVAIPRRPEGFPKYDPILQLRKEYLVAIEAEILLAEDTTESRMIEQSIRKGSTKMRLESALRNAAAYCDNVERVYDSLPGWHRTGIKRQLHQQLIDAVLFQIKTLEYGTIAELLHTTSDRVGTNVRRILKTIDLERRADATGRGRAAGEFPTAQLTTQQERELRLLVKGIVRRLSDYNPTDPVAVKSKLERLRKLLPRRFQGPLIKV